MIDGDADADDDFDHHHCHRHNHHHGKNLIKVGTRRRNLSGTNAVSPRHFYSTSGGFQILLVDVDDDNGDGFNLIHIG